MKENIFSNFYTKVLNFFTSGKNEGESSRDTASNRLKLVLMQDRSNLDGATMQKMREQLIDVISKYIEIDTEALDLNLEGDGEEIALMLNIPVIRARTKEEIEEIEAKEEEAQKAAIEEALKAKEESEENKETENTTEENNDETASEEEEEEEEKQQNEENELNYSEETNNQESHENSEENSEENSVENSVETENNTEEDKPKKTKKNKK